MMNTETRFKALLETNPQIFDTQIEGLYSTYQRKGEYIVVYLQQSGKVGDTLTPYTVFPAGLTPTKIDSRTDAYTQKGDEITLMTYITAPIEGWSATIELGKDLNV